LERGVFRLSITKCLNTLRYAYQYSFNTEALSVAFSGALGGVLVLIKETGMYIISQKL